MKSSIRKVVIATGLALALWAMSASHSSADTIAFNENAAPDSTPSGTGLVGFEFTVNQDIDLTQLGFYAQSIGGGDTPHVSLIDLTSGPANPPTVIFDTGTVATSAGWNYYSVGTPILLTPGNTYAVTAPIYFSEQYNSTAGFTLGSAINTSAYLLDPGFNGWANSGYNFTSLSATSPGANISANFQYTTVATPEPSTYLMLGVGLSVLLVTMRRRTAQTTL